MQGIFYGIGVGPGDPELLTIKAIKTMQSCEVLAIAVSSPELTVPEYRESKEEGELTGFLEKCVAYQIVLPMVPEIAEKPKLYFPMPMMKDKERLKEVHDACARKAAEILDTGKSIACITLGDPTVYSTCLYVHKRLQKQEYKTRLIPGIPSFCAAAARLDIGLAENKEELHVIPASYEIADSLKLPGTKVLMKAGRKMADVKRVLKQGGYRVKMVENCGMETEMIYQNVEEIPDCAGYYSLLIVKDKK